MFERWVHARERLLKGSRNARYSLVRDFWPESRYLRIVTSMQHWCVGISNKTFELFHAILMVLYVLSFTHLSFFGPSIEWNIMKHRIRWCRSAAPWVWKPGFRADDIKTVDPSQSSFPVLKRQKSFRSWPGLLDYLFVIPIFQGHPSIFSEILWISW